MKDIELLFLGYVNEKRLIYNIKEKKYVYGYKEDSTMQSRKTWILTMFSYPFIKLINDNFIIYSDIIKILIIVLSAIFILFMASKWRIRYRKAILLKYKKQNFEEACLESSYLVNHLIKVKKSVRSSIFIVLILIVIYILFIIYYMWSSKFIGILFANCTLPFPWHILIEIKSQNITNNLNSLIDLENKKIKEKQIQ